MHHQTYQGKLHELWKRYSFALLILMAVLCFSQFLVYNASALYILTGSTNTAIVLDDSANSATVKSFTSQLVYVGSTSNGYEVTLEAGQTVTIHYNGATVSAQAKSETISSLLNRLSIEPSPLDMVLVDVSGAGTELTIASDLTYYDTETEPVAYVTLRVPNAKLSVGTEKVTQEGADGVRTAVYEVTYSNGELVSRQFAEELNSTEVDCIVEYGTASTQPAASTENVTTPISSSDRISCVAKNSSGGGALTFQSGKTVNFSAVKSMTATAYTQGHGGADTYTATGTSVHVGTVAVDKNVIPLGSKLYIVTDDGKYVYGYAVAEDTGVKGSTIDLYYDTYRQCIMFGRRSCTVYVLN